MATYQTNEFNSIQFENHTNPSQNTVASQKRNTTFEHENTTPMPAHIITNSLHFQSKIEGIIHFQDLLELNLQADHEAVPRTRIPTTLSLSFNNESIASALESFHAPITTTCCSSVSRGFLGSYLAGKGLPALGYVGSRFTC